MTQSSWADVREDITPIKCEWSRGVMPTWYTEWIVPLDGIRTGVEGGDDRVGVQMWKSDVSWSWRVRRLRASLFSENCGSKWVKWCAACVTGQRISWLTITLDGLRSQSLNGTFQGVWPSYIHRSFRPPQFPLSRCSSQAIWPLELRAGENTAPKLPELICTANEGENKSRK